jgi:hypothetical protein
LAVTAISGSWTSLTLVVSNVPCENVAPWSVDR